MGCNLNNGYILMEQIAQVEMVGRIPQVDIISKGIKLEKI